MSTSRKFGPAELARVLDCPLESAVHAFDRAHPPELIYRPLTAAETSATLAEVDDIIRNKPLRAAGANDSEVWERGWTELAARLQHQRITLQTLRPQYFHAGQACRLFGALIEPITPDFEYWVGVCVRFAIFAACLRDRHHVVEFGCGTGINIFLLSHLFPTARLVGCDWATASQKILAQMARETGVAIEGRRFNMLVAEGDCGGVTSDSAVLTVTSLEQLGDGWRPFLEFLLAQHAGIYVHVEPLLELYESSAPLDDLARRYHLKRNYLRGFVPAIRNLATNGQAEILTLRRAQFSGLYHEGYSVLAWRALPGAVRNTFDRL